MGKLLTLVADVYQTPRPVLLPSGLIIRSITASGFVIRSITAEDVVGLGQLYYEAYDPGVACATLEEAIAEIKATFRGEYGELWLAGSAVIEHNGTLVAAVLIAQRAPWDNTPDCPFIIELFTARPFRRQSLARALLGRCFALAGETERPRVALRVDATNEAALRLYESLGFREWRSDSF